MSEDREIRLHFLPAILLLGLIVLLIAAAFFLLSGIPEPAFLKFEQKAPAAQVMLIPSDTPTETVTPSPSPTLPPTWTLQPTATFTPSTTPTWTATATRVRMPTLTPARPALINQRYEFVILDAERMDLLTSTIADYPDARFRTPDSRLDPAYNAYFIYPSLAYQEALLRFPDAAQANRWQWGLAYSLARLGDQKAVTLYQQIISRGIDLEDLSVQELPDWFNRQAVDLTLRVHKLSLSPGQPELFLLEIPQGNVFYLLNPDAQPPDHLHALTGRFDLSNGGKAAFTTLDLDADGTSELALYLPDPAHPASINPPAVFSLTETTPQSLQVSHRLDIDYQMDYSITMSPQNPDGEAPQVLELSAVFYPACPFSLMIAYSWDGELPGVIQSDPPEYMLDPVQETLSYCDPLLSHAVAFWPLEAQRVIEQVLLPVWPPQTDPQGRPYFASDRDELRFQYGLTLALIGYPDRLQEAQEVLQELVEAPNDPAGPWSEAAQEFLAQLDDGSGLYSACQAAGACDMRQVFQSIAAQEDAAQTVASLPRLGVTVRSSGIFDFDQDGTPERWVVIRPRPSSQLEFWILAQTGIGVQALFVDLVDSNDTQPYLSDPQVYPGVFQLKASHGFRLQHFSQSSFILEPVDVNPILTTYTRDTLFIAEEALMLGTSPVKVRDDLLLVLNSGRYNCLNHRVCDRFLYLLGLSYELAGDYSEARDTYIKLWWENSSSPLTAMARMKLNLIVPTATPTRTPTLSSIVTPSATPTLTPTSTPTLTATP